MIRFVGQNKYWKVACESIPQGILPRSPLVFKIGNSDSTPAFVRKIKWPGKGPLPEDVLEYLNENGVLPPHTRGWILLKIL